MCLANLLNVKLLFHLYYYLLDSFKFKSRINYLMKQNEVMNIQIQLPYLVFFLDLLWFRIVLTTLHTQQIHYNDTLALTLLMLYLFQEIFGLKFAQQDGQDKKENTETLTDEYDEFMHLNVSIGSFFSINCYHRVCHAVLLLNHFFFVFMYRV